LALGLKKMEKILALIKPDAVADGHINAIRHEIESNGFVIISSQQELLSRSRAGMFYEEHRGKPFFGTLQTFMSSGPVIALLLAKEDAISDFRKLMGPTDAKSAKITAPKTLRARYQDRPFTL
jgi:nucleoside-diphosphate kinase